MANGAAKPPNQQAGSYFDDWAVWGLPAFAAIFAPWQDKLTAMSLISDYFQPELNFGASVLGPLFCMSTYAITAKKSQKAVRKALAISLLVFLIVFFACIILKYTIDVTFFPAPEFQVFVRIFWLTAYLMIFIFLGISMTSAAVAIKKQGGA